MGIEVQKSALPISFNFARVRAASKPHVTSDWQAQDCQFESLGKYSKIFPQLYTAELPNQYTIQKHLAEHFIRGKQCRLKWK